MVDGNEKEVGKETLGYISRKTTKKSRIKHYRKRQFYEDVTLGAVEIPVQPLREAQVFNEYADNEEPPSLQPRSQGHSRIPSDVSTFYP